MELTKDERMLLASMAETELSQYGECYGATFDRLLDKGLVEMLGEDTETRNPFIAKGHGIMYRAVRVTDAGRAILDAM